MREFKFRAFDKDRGNMEYIDDLYWFEEEGVRDSSGDGHYANYVLMQYTGIKDSKGKEIYEGDIISEIYEDVPDIGLVYFAEGMFKVNFRSSEDYYLAGCDLEQTEVIGNVYENKDKYKELYDFFIL